MFYLQIGTKRRADERTRTADLLITSLLAHVLACTGASGNWLVYGVFDDLGVSVCPLCTSAYEPGCSMGCSTCVVGMRLCGSGASRSRISIQDPTCRGLSSSVDALRIEPYGFEVMF